MPSAIQLSTVEFDVLWEHLGLGPFPTVLAIDSPGATLDERAELAAKVWDSLAHRGLGWPAAPDPRVVRRLRTLARPEWELDARLQVRTGEPRTSALVAVRRSTAVTAVLHDDRVTLRTAPPDRITRAALALLPPHPAGTGASITLPADILDSAATRAGSDPGELARALESRGLGAAEARKIAEVSGRVVRFGHFGATRTSTLDKRRRAGHVVSVYDSTAGRYLFTRKPGGGRHWVTLVPGTDAAILRQLDELLAELDR